MQMTRDSKEKYTRGALSEAEGTLSEVEAGALVLLRYGCFHSFPPPIVGILNIPTIRLFRETSRPGTRLLIIGASAHCCWRQSVDAPLRTASDAMRVWQDFTIID